MNPFADHQVFCEQGIDNLEDMIDLFWEQPFAFATFVYHRYPDQMTDALPEGFIQLNASLHRRLPLFARCSSARATTITEMIIPCQSVRAFTRNGRHFGEPNSPVGTTEEWMGAR